MPPYITGIMAENKHMINGLCIHLAKREAAGADVESVNQGVPYWNLTFQNKPQKTLNFKRAVDFPNGMAPLGWS